MLSFDLKKVVHGINHLVKSLLNRRYGVPLIDGGTVRLPAVVGHGRALHLAMTGEKVESCEAERIGLITKVVPDGGTIEAAVQLANQISKFPDGLSFFLSS